MIKKVSFHTLGCKLNFSETSTIAREFYEKGFKKVKFGDKTDVVVLNTCTVTGIADKKCRQAIKKAKKKSPNAFIVVTGCYAQADAENISKMDGVDVVLGMNEKFNLFKYFNSFEKGKETIIHSCETSEIESFDSAFSSGDRTRSFLKVQDGCDYPCTYCKIPSVRGKSRSDNVKNTVKHAFEIANLGFKEIILTGVNIGDFGKGTDENFFKLIKELDKVEGIQRYRISSIEPNLITDEIIDFVAKSDKFLPHFHIPLQSGSDAILKNMKRRYDTSLFKNKINRINNIIPNAFIGIDVIVGFPGETEDDFNDTYTLLENLNISFIHVFSYSIREGTVAENMPNKVSSNIIKERSSKLHKLSNEKHISFYNRFLNTKHKVLFEGGKKNEFMYGFTENYIKVKTKYDENLINKIKSIKIVKIINTDDVEIEFI